MQTGWSVELEEGDPTLALPWEAEDRGLRYYDLKGQSELLPKIAEAQDNPELGEFLLEINSPRSAFQTAKCDVWTSDLMDVEDEVFDAACKCCSYIDVLAGDRHFQQDFVKNEKVLKRLALALRPSRNTTASVEFTLRRCYFDLGTPAEEEGFYFTFYLNGYGRNQEEARRSWVEALKIVQDALLLTPLQE